MAATVDTLGVVSWGLLHQKTVKYLPVPSAGAWELAVESRPSLEIDAETPQVEVDISE